MVDTNSESSQSSRADRAFTAVFAVLFIALAVTTLLLVKQNRELKANMAQMERSGFELPGPSLEIGETLAPFELRSLGGEIMRLAYDDDGQDTLLLIFSPECPACKQNMGNWKQLEATGESGGKRIYYISTVDEDQTRPYADEHDLAAL